MMLADVTCRAVLRLFPKDIRDAHGAEMRETFRAVCESRSAIPELVDLATSAIKARAGFPRIPSGHDPMKMKHHGSGVASALASDSRQAMRALLARPGTTALAVMLLAVAIAACTAVFTIADSVIFNQVPYRDAERIACVGVKRAGAMFPSAYSPAAVVRAWREAGIFERIEAHESMGVTLDGAEPTTEPAARVTAGLIDLLGIRPLRGRLFRIEDAREPITPVLISEGLWRSRFGGDEALIGRTISLDGQSTQVIGVMPSHFRFPHGRQVVWKVFDLNAPPKETRNVTPVVKLQAGVPRDESARLAAEVVRGVNPAMMGEGTSVGFNLPSGGQSFDAYTVNTIRVLFTAVLLVLLVACVNVANLLLAQALGRRRERAVRTALGASRVRLVRQALLESTAIAAIASVLGLFLAWAAIAGFDTLLPEYISTRAINAIDFDRRAAALVVGLTVIATIAAGALPAWLGTRTAGGAMLKDGDRSASEGRAGRRIATALIVSEIAVSVALLAGAALMMRSFVALATAERGIDTRGLVKLQLSLPDYQETDPQKRAALSTAVFDKVAALPGVEQITRTYGIPPSGGMIQFWPIQNDEGKTFERIELMGFRVTPDFFPMFGMELRAGRLLRDDDPESAVVVGDGLTAKLWPGVAHPVGRTFKIGPATKEIVGITREVRTPLLDPRSDIPEYFELYKGKGTSFAIRFREGSAVPDDELKAVVRSVHPKFIVQKLEPIDAAYDAMIERPRAAVMAATTFAAFGTIVCAAGLFSVLSLSVARRRREFGIRLAIGAHPSQLSRLVMRQTAVTLAAGIVLGVAGAFALARNLSSVLAGVDTSDAASWIAVVVLIAAAGIGAAWLPVRDARRTDPLLLLREE